LLCGIFSGIADSPTIRFARVPISRGLIATGNHGLQESLRSAAPCGGNVINETVITVGVLFGAFARGKSTGGTKAPPYGVEEGFLKLTALPLGEAFRLPGAAVRWDGEGRSDRSGGVSPPDTAVQRDGRPVPYDISVRWDGEGRSGRRGGVSSPGAAVQRDGRPVPYGVSVRRDGKPVPYGVSVRRDGEPVPYGFMIHPSIFII